MKIHSVKLVNFKSIGEYGNNEIIIEPEVTAIIGQNESGKSNVLLGLSKIDFINNKNSSYNEDLINRKAERGSGISYHIVLTHNEEEIAMGANVETEVDLRKGCIECKGGIVACYDSLCKESFDKIFEILKSINPNPFKLYGDESKKYYNDLEDFKNENCINILKRSEFLGICKNKKDIIPSEKIEEYNFVLDQIETAWNKLLSLFPRVFYRNSDKVLRASYSYDEVRNELNNTNLNPNSLLREIVKLTGVNNQEFLFAVQGGSEPKQLTLRDDIQTTINKVINKGFHKFYTTEKINFGVSFNAGILSFTVKKEDGKLLKLEERSNGLKWYLNLYIDMLAHDITGVNTVFLLDEPGVSLHVNAQRELLKLFHKIPEKGNQIIYTTHSPYMLDLENDGIHRIRAVVKNDDEFTYIYKTAYDAKIAPDSRNDTLTPIIRALGMNLNDTFGPAKDKINIVTEGASDYIYITMMAKILGVDLNKYTIIPSEGATNCVNICMILHGWGCKFIALFDFDEEGVESGGEKIRTMFGTKIGDNFIYVVDKTQEDVKTKAYKSKPVMIEDIVTREEIDRFCKEKECAGSKSLIAKLMENFVQDGSFELNEKCKENFKSLFKRLGIYK